MENRPETWFRNRALLFSRRSLLLPSSALQEGGSPSVCCFLMRFLALQAKGFGLYSFPEPFYLVACFKLSKFPSQASWGNELDIESLVIFSSDEGSLRNYIGLCLLWLGQINTLFPCWLTESCEISPSLCSLQTLCLCPLPAGLRNIWNSRRRSCGWESKREQLPLIAGECRSFFLDGSL